LLNLLQLVCFDVDSTFCSDESIDEIAAFLGKGEEVAALTRQAMGGSMQFQDALKARLDVMNVSRDDLSRFQQEHPFQLSPGALATDVNLIGNCGNPIS
jgi:phosphoserine phosphatase